MLANMRVEDALHGESLLWSFDISLFSPLVKRFTASFKMAVVELGTYTVRAGYAGDVATTYASRAICCPSVPEAVDFISVLTSAARNLQKRESPACEAAGGPSQASYDGDSFLPLWSLRRLEEAPAAHMAMLTQLKRRVLRCTAEEPLCLVVPELWHERLDVMKAIFELVLETADLTSALYCMRPSVGWTLSAGKASSVVMDIGHSHTTTTAVLDGYALRHSIDSAPVGGDAVTAQYGEILKDYRDAFLTPWSHLSCHPAAAELLWQEVVSDIKHCFGRVATRSGDLSNSAAPPSPLLNLQTPDGEQLQLKERYSHLPYEIFFDSSTTGGFNAATMLSTCKQRMDPEWQVHAIPHLLAGAGGRVPGFRDRMVSELKEKDSSYFRYEREGAVQVAESSDGAWIGASMAAASSSFEPLWVTRTEWNEEGLSVLQRKLFY